MKKVSNPSRQLQFLFIVRNAKKNELFLSSTFCYFLEEERRKKLCVLLNNGIFLATGVPKIFINSAPFR